MKIFFSLFLISSLCMASEDYQTSTDIKYSDVLGKTYRLKTDFIIHGYSGAESASDVVSYFVVTDKPGMAGREILSRNVVPYGTLIRIDAAISCGWCILKRDRFLISFMENEEWLAKRVEFKDIFDKDLFLFENSKIFLNPEFFEKEN